MPKNREELKKRLYGSVIISGPDTTTTELHLNRVGNALPTLMVFAIRVATNQAESHGAPSLRSIRDAARKEATNDLLGLGHAPTKMAVQGYLDECYRWTGSAVDSTTLQAEILRIRRSAPAPMKTKIERSMIERAASGKGSSRGLSAEGKRAVRRAIERTVLTSLLHERALRMRQDFLTLAACPQLPATSRFRELLDYALRDLVRARRTPTKAAIEAAIGASAANSSRWRLEALKWELERCDLELRPLGTYLNLRPSAAPKILRIWSEIDYRLRRVLSPERSNYAISRILAAVLHVYGGRLAPAGDPDAYARDGIEKLRNRMGEVWTRELEEQIAREESRIAFTRGPGGAWEVSLEPPSVRTSAENRRKN